MLLTLVAVLSGCAAIVVCIAGSIAHVRDPARAQPWIAVGVLAAVSAGAAVVPVREARLEGELSQVVSALSLRDARVSCEAALEVDAAGESESGHVLFDATGRAEAVARLTPDTCRGLRAYRANPAGAGEAEIRSVGVLAHEAMHVGGIQSEAEAECAGLQRVGRAAQLLGADPEVAAATSRGWYEGGHQQLGASYRSPECRAGGALDERLGLAPWS